MFNPFGLTMARYFSDQLDAQFAFIDVNFMIKRNIFIHFNRAIVRKRERGKRQMFL